MIKNKIILVIGALFLLNFKVVQCQEDTTQRAYNFDNWRVLFQMNGPNNWNGKINFVKPIHAKWALRFAMGPIISFNKTIAENPNVTQYSAYELKNVNRKMGGEIAFGAEYHLLKKGKVDPYLFFGIGLGAFREVSELNRSFTTITPLPSGTVKLNRNEVNKSAPQIALDPFLGFGVNYFFHERVAFGIEYSCSPNMILNKGKSITNIDETEEFDDGTVSTLHTALETDRNAFYLQANPQIGFHLIYVFQKKD